MGKYSVQIINGKEYGVYTDDDGIPMILGDPQKDMAEAIAKAQEKNDDIFDYEKYFSDSVDSIVLSNEEKEELEKLNDQSKVEKAKKSPSEAIIDSMRENGDYDIDPRFGAPRYYEGTTIRTEEYDEYIDNKSHKEWLEAQQRFKRQDFIKKALIITGCVLAGLLLIGYITYMIFNG